MARPETIPGCPPGLEYLTQIDQLLVHKQVELLEGIWFLLHTLYPLLSTMHSKLITESIIS